MKAHKNSIISEDSNIAENVVIGPFSIIEGGVDIDSDTEIGAYVHIKKNTSIGKNNKIFDGAIIGQQPQDVSYKKNTKSGIIIGNNNTIREYVTIHLSSNEGKYTHIGNNCYIMVGTHIAHDCTIEDNVTIVNNVSMAGYVKIERNAFLSGHVGIHQHCTIGAYSMIGSCEKISQDVVPYCLIDGFPAKTTGINTVGLKRANFTQKQRQNIKKAYKILFREKLSIKNSLIRLKTEFEHNENINYIINFVKNSIKNGRGIIKYQ